MYKRMMAILIVLGLSTLACSVFNIQISLQQPVQGSGKVASERRDVAGFTSVGLYGSADVDVTFGDSETVVVEADDNILPLIDTKVQRGQLIINNKPNPSYRTSNPVLVHITMKSLDRVGLPGSGSFTVTGLSADSVKIDLPGSGSIHVTGEANQVNVSLNGSGIVSCKELKAQNATVRLNGSGNISVYASSSLDATIGGSGNILYSGSPAKLNKKVFGSGTIAADPSGAEPPQGQVYPDPSFELTMKEASTRC